LERDVFEIELSMSWAVVDEEKNLAILTSKLAIPTLNPILK
jgi:hypothetical protein